MPHTTTWTLVANSSHATIYRITKFPKLERIYSLEHPEGRLHDRDLVSDRPGRGFESMGTTRHAYQQVTDPRQAEIDHFARKLCTYLDSSYLKGEFNRLYVVANPFFLGLLRKHLGKQTQQSIVGEIAKDMIEQSTTEIEKQIENL